MNHPASQGRLPGEASVMEKLERVSQASGLWPQRPEPSPGVRSQSFCLAKRMPVSPDIRPSSLDSQSKRGLGLGPRQPASFLIQTWSTAAVYRRRQAQEGWGLVRGHIAQESYGPYRPPGPPDLSPLHTLTLKMKEGGSLVALRCPRCRDLEVGGHASRYKNKFQRFLYLSVLNVAFLLRTDVGSFLTTKCFNNASSLIFQKLKL